MSLINNDFRLHKIKEESRGHTRLRWALFALACAGIGAVIASTNTEVDESAEIATKSLPEFTAVTKSSEELARESFSLSLPELQAQQKIIDDANHLNPKQWREYKVKSGDNLARLFKRADIKPQQLDELMKSGDAVKTLRRIYPKDTIRLLSGNDGVLQALRYDIDHKSYLM
ncbi:MAG: LysM-like peptidoglycan-binding domain-containing protein, partial [Gammaproteobacteria bacterium]